MLRRAVVFWDPAALGAPYLGGFVQNHEVLLGRSVHGGLHPLPNPAGAAFGQALSEALSLFLGYAELDVGVYRYVNPIAACNRPGKDPIPSSPRARDRYGVLHRAVIEFRFGEEHKTLLRAARPGWRASLQAVGMDPTQPYGPHPIRSLLDPLPECANPCDPEAAHQETQLALQVLLIFGKLVVR